MHSSPILRIRRFALRATFNKENKVRVKKFNIHYFKFGHGPKHVLFLTGGLGDGISMKPVQEAFDPDKFTTIAWDPPGYGMSRPPDRVLSDSFYEEDADYAYEFMKALKIPSYSVMGHCGGGRVAMILAAQHPDLVESLILVNTSSYVLPHEIEKQMKYIDIQKWSPKIRDKFKDITSYSDEEVQKIVTHRFDSVFKLYRKRKNDVCSSILHLIECKTLILGGAKDILMDTCHANYLNNSINNARLHVYPEGGHYVHFSYTVDVVDRVQRFIFE